VSDLPSLEPNRTEPNRNTDPLARARSLEQQAQFRKFHTAYSHFSTNPLNDTSTPPPPSPMMTPPSPGEQPMLALNAPAKADLEALMNQSKNGLDGLLEKHPDMLDAWFYK
jgi:hypothetical protein